MMQVQRAYQDNEVDGVLAALGPADLILLAVAVLPMEQLEDMVDRVAKQATTALIALVGYKLSVAVGGELSSMALVQL